MNAVSEYAIERLRRWGYTESESRFLCLVATHSGYFFLKHYTGFIGSTSNKRTAKFIKKALANGDIQARPYQHGNSKLYHLCARRIYAQLELENSSLRKVRKPGSVTLARTRLLVTSFIVQHPYEVYLETETDKIAYFAQLGIGREKLPSKRFRNRKGREFVVRYFPDKFPIFIAGWEEWKDQASFDIDRETKRTLKLYCRFTRFSINQVIVRALKSLFAADPEFGTWLEKHKAAKSTEENIPAILPKVFFTYFDEGTAGVREFAAWLERLWPLIDSLEGAYHLLYVSGTDGNFRKAERLFCRVVGPEHKRNAIEEYFRLRELWETKKYSKLTQKDIAKLNKGGRTFSGPLYEKLFTAWKRAAFAGEKTALIPLMPSGRLSTILLGF